MGLKIIKLTGNGKFSLWLEVYEELLQSLWLSIWDWKLKLKENKTSEMRMWFGSAPVGSSSLRNIISPRSSPQASTPHTPLNGRSWWMKREKWLSSFELL